MDPHYWQFLSGDNNFQRTKDDTEVTDPHYAIFLNSLKQDGNIWVFLADERNKLPENLNIENVSNDRLDQDVGKETVNIKVENVEHVRSNSYSPDSVGSLCKKQRKTIVEDGIELTCSDSTNPDPFQVEKYIDEDPDTAISCTSSLQHNLEKFGGSADKCNGKNVRNSLKVSKGREFEVPRNLEYIDSNYRIFLQNRVNYEDEEMVAGSTNSEEGSHKPIALPGRFDGDVDDCFIYLESPRGAGDSPFREQLMDILRKPFDKEELQMLKTSMKATQPIKRNMDLRHGRERGYLTNKDGKSYLDHYPGLRRKLEAAADFHLELNLLRGFFFWLQNLAQEGAIQPWVDKAFLAVSPGDH